MTAGDALVPSEGTACQFGCDAGVCLEGPIEGTELTDSELAVIRDQLAADCTAAFGDPNCEIQTPEFPSYVGEGYPSTACATCFTFSGQGCECGDAPTYCESVYDGEGPTPGDMEPVVYAAVGPAARIVGWLARIYRGGRAVASFGTGFVGRMRNATRLHDEAMAALRLGNRTLHRQLAMQALRQTAMATAEITFAAGELYAMAQAAASIHAELTAHPDLNNVHDGMRNWTREELLEEERRIGREQERLEQQLREVERVRQRIRDGLNP